MVQLTHFQAAAIFALCTSVVFAVTTKDSNRERFVYGAWCFGAFLAVVLGLGWFMRLGHG